MKRLAAFLLSLLLPIAALAQSPGVGLDALPSASALGGGELIFMYQPGAGGGGAAICARGWCPVSATPLQVATYITGLGRFTTITGAITTGHCAEWASATSLEDSGSACGGGGGGAPTNAAALASNSMGQIIAATTVPLFTGSFTATHCVNVSTGSPVTFSDSGSVCAGAGISQLTGDVTAGPGSGSVAASVVQVNGAVVPATAAALASNSSRQIIAATTVPLFSGSFTLNDCVQVGTASPVTFTDTGSACGLGVLFQTNAVNNLSQAALNLQSSNGISVSNATSGNIAIAPTQAINAQVGTSYAINCLTDGAKVVTFNNGSAVAVSIPQANGNCGAGLALTVENLGAGTATITPATSTINGSATLTISQGRGCSIVSDGTNYQVAACTALISAGGGTVTTSGSPANFQTAVFTAGSVISGISTGAAGQCLMSNGGSANPSYQTCGSTPQVSNPTSGTNVTPNCTFNVVKIVASTTGTFTVNAPNTCTPADAQSLILKVTSPAGGTITYSWNAAYLASATVALPSTSNAASKEDYFAFRYDADKVGWVFLAANQGF